MRDLTSIVMEMERQGKRLHGLLPADVLNSLTQEQFSATERLKSCPPEDPHFARATAEAAVAA